MTEFAEEQHSSELDNEAVVKLKDYVSKYSDGILLAGPPVLHGSLAHFYHEYTKESGIIKACEHEEHKMGIHSFVRKYNDVFRIHGKAAYKRVILADSISKPKMSCQSQVERQCDSEEVQLLHHRINELRGTIRSIYVLINELNAQVENVSSSSVFLSKV